MGSKSNGMVLADSLHHDDMRNINTNFGWSNLKLNLYYLILVPLLEFMENFCCINHNVR
jgi:hypothetical protein